MILGFNLGCAFGFFGLALTGGFTAFRIGKAEGALAVGNCLSAGVFLGGALMHLLPEATEKLNELAPGQSPSISTISVGRSQIFHSRIFCVVVDSS